MYFSDGDAVEICDNEADMREQMDRLEPRGFEKYEAYLDRAQLNLEVGWMRGGGGRYYQLAGEYEFS